MTETISLPDLVYLKGWIVACNNSNPKSANWLGGVLSRKYLVLTERKRAQTCYQKALDVCLRDYGLRP